MKCVVFGASGFLGSHLIDYLNRIGENTVAVKREGIYNVNITHADAFQVLRDINADVIINCASVLPDTLGSISDTDQLKKFFETNVIGGANILHYANDKRIKRVINCSTLSIANKPWPIPLREHITDLPTGKHIGYTASKLSQELVMNEMARQFGIDLLHLRLSALYGVGMKQEGILFSLVDKITCQEKIALTDATKISFDFLLVDDLVKIIYCLLEKEWKYSTINVASGEEIFLIDLLQKIEEASGIQGIVEYYETNGPSSRAVINIDRLKEMLGENLQMTSIAEGINKIIGYHLHGKTCAI